jgi:hypothetical protein
MRKEVKLTEVKVDGHYSCEVFDPTAALGSPKTYTTYGTGKRMLARLSDEPYLQILHIWHNTIETSPDVLEILFSVINQLDGLITTNTIAYEKVANELKSNVHDDELHTIMTRLDSLNIELKRQRNNYAFSLQLPNATTIWHNGYQYNN